MGYNADGVTFLKDTRGHAGVTGVKKSRAARGNCKT